MVIPFLPFLPILYIQRHASAAWPHTLYLLFSVRRAFEFRQPVARNALRRLPTSECQLREQRSILFRWASRSLSPPSRLLQILAEWNVCSIRLLTLFPVLRLNCVRSRRACPTCLCGLVVKHHVGGESGCPYMSKPLLTFGNG